MERASNWSRAELCSIDMETVKFTLALKGRDIARHKAMDELNSTGTAWLDAFEAMSGVILVRTIVISKVSKDQTTQLMPQECLFYLN